MTPTTPPSYGDPADHGRYGILDHTDDGVICHLCGRPWQYLTIHLRRTHDITADEYRETYGLGKTTPLVSHQLHEKMSAAWEKKRTEHLAALEQGRDPAIGRAAAGITRGYRWRPEVRAKRAEINRSKRGRPLTPDERATLGGIDVDLQEWADAARALLALDGVSARSLAEACDIATPTVHQRLRRYPPRT